MFDLERWYDVVNDGRPCPRFWFWLLLAVLILTFWGFSVLVILKVLSLLG